MDLQTETFGAHMPDDLKSNADYAPYIEMKGIDLLNAHKDLSAQVTAFQTERDEMTGKLTAFETEKADLTGKVTAFETEKQSYEDRLAHAIEPLPEGATPEQKKEYADILRAVMYDVPEGPDKYALQLPKEVPADDPLVASYLVKAHEAGMSVEQAQAGVNAFVEYAAAAEKQAREASDAALKTKWGNDFETNVRAAFGVIEAGYKEAGLPVEEAAPVINVLRNNPAVVQALYQLSRHYSEAVLSGAGGGPGAGNDPARPALDRWAERIAARTPKP